MRRKSAYAVVGKTAPPAGSVKPEPLGWLRRLHHLKTEHQFLGRYSIEKLHAFHDYQTNVRWWRVAIVLGGALVPTLVALVAMDVVPMNDPSAGPHQNTVCFVRSVLSHGVMTFVCLLPVRQALGLNDSGKYSLKTVAVIALLTCIIIESVWIPLAFVWRFPVPFRELLGAPLWCAVVLLLHRWLARGVFARRPRRTRVYLAVVTCQFVVLYSFLALSMAFAHVPLPVQVVFMVLLPLCKIAIKRFIWKFARQLDDISTDVTVCMVEVSASLYQTVCLQFAKSTAITVIIMVTDLLQAMLEVHAYISTEYVVDGRATLTTAMAILQSAEFPGADERPSLGNCHSSSVSHQSLTDSASTARRMSGTSASGVTLRRRLRKPMVSSVFVQPKLIKKHASKRLLDLRRFDFDAIDGRGDRPEADSSAPQLGHGPHAMVQQWVDERQQRQLVLDDRTSPLAAVIRSSEKTKTARTMDSRPAQGDPASSLRVASATCLKDPSSLSAHAQRVSSSPMSELSKARRSPVRGWLNTRLAPSIKPPSPSRARPPLISKGSLTKVSPVASLPQSKRTESPKPPNSSVASHSPARSQRSSLTGAPVVRTASFDQRRRGSAVAIDGVQVARKDQARILEQALQLLFSCEVLLFVEFVEMAMPLLYALYIGIEFSLPNTKYNLMTRHMTDADVASTITSAVIYALLEMISLAVLNYFVWRKYGISPVHLLAFTIETYTPTLQGKLVGMFIVIHNMATVHQGVDFTFRFDYGQRPNG